MAFIVSVNFSTLRCTSKTLIQEKHSGRCSGRTRLLRSFNNRTVMNLVAPKFLHRDEWSLNTGCKPQLMEASRHSRDTSISSNLFVSFSHPVVLLGFWVGPDIEDGWGFVEALVNQIF